MDPIRSWFSQNQALALFLIAQAIAMAAAAATILAYSVKLETRVHTMETRGAEYTVARMQALEHRLTVLEQNIKQNEYSINRIIAIMTRDLGKPPP